MTSKKEAPKHYLYMESPQKKIESKPALIAPSFYNPQNLNFCSTISEKNNYKDERLNNFNFCKGGLVCDVYNNGLFPCQNKFMQNTFLNWPLCLQSQKSSIRFSNYVDNYKNNKIKLNENNFLLNYLLKEQEENFKEKQNNTNKNIVNYDNNYNNKYNCPYYFLNGHNINDNMNGNINLKQKNWTPEKNINLNLNMNIETPINIKNNINNKGTKFFTNHNYGYKCSCSKTHCNRKYCECFNSGNYCIDCNCKNCNNKPPVNSYTNKHPTDESSKNKKEKIICTCTKSGCNKNYCECYKNGNKCTSLCRCISCENNDEINIKKNNVQNYECCPENSIYIIKNDIYIENIKNKIGFNIATSSAMKENLITLCKKRKREETKNNEENYEKKKTFNKKTEDFELFNDSLFDKNGKVILRHINLIHM